MSNFNKTILLGRLGKDPDLSYTQSGTARCKFSMATSEKRTDNQTGNVTEKTEWHRVIVWGKQAENVAKFLRKGDLALLEGKLTYYEFEDQKTGQKVRIAEVVAHQVTFMPKGANRGGGGGGAPRDQGSQDSGGQSAGSDGGEQGGGGFNPDDDDIPF